MKNAFLVAAIAALVGGQLIATARADTADATCEVRKDGDKQKGKSGPCTFGQRQGYIDIDLKNGETLSLSPAGGANQYHDQHHNKVHRLSSNSHTQEFKWEGGKHVIVTFNGTNYGNNYNKNYNNNNYGNDYGNRNNGYNDSNRGYGAGAAGYRSGKERDDYQRGYNDGQAGRYDQYDHTQAYKDGVRAGENESRNGRGNEYGKGQHNGGDHGNYTIENIGNGDFEVKWGKQNCIADYDRHGNSTGYTNCNDNMKRRSDEIARQRAR